MYFGHPDIVLQAMYVVYLHCTVWNNANDTSTQIVWHKHRAVLHILPYGIQGSTCDESFGERQNTLEVTVSLILVQILFIG